MLTDDQLSVLLQEMHGSVLGGDEPSSAVAEEVAPLAEESVLAPQVVPEPPVAETPLPEASIVEGEYSSEAMKLLEE
jgi:hypothetical protein